MNSKTSCENVSYNCKNKEKKNSGQCKNKQNNYSQGESEKNGKIIVIGASAIDSEYRPLKG